MIGKLILIVSIVISNNIFAQKVIESKIVKNNEFLSGNNGINIKKGFLNYTLNVLDEFFKYIDSLI